ncbi:hypothetical protein [uncultured Rubinisphaera sp.]|uniref:hypothetical protein n=1 Tax=uncultured Rubinisphaera sp. TaxID=1678686 RepID=UPI0030D973E4
MCCPGNTDSDLDHSSEDPVPFATCTAALTDAVNVVSAPTPKGLPAPVTEAENPTLTSCAVSLETSMALDAVKESGSGASGGQR